MAIRLQMLHALMEAHPDRAERLRPHVLALEAGIEAEPGLCLHRVRALFEAMQVTIAPIIGIDFGDVIDFTQRNKRIIEALSFTVDGHPQSKDIDAKIKMLLGSINGMAKALAELSNIPNLRHGGSLDWATLERQHAIMLGGLCDTLVSFLFEVAWNRQPKAPPVELPRYEDFAAFNDYLDDEYETVEVAGSKFQPSRVLFGLEPTKYDLLRQEWVQENEAPAVPDEAVA
jgi:hypothetical protein